MSDLSEMENLKNTIEALRADNQRLRKEAEGRVWGMQKTNEAIKTLYKDLEQKNEELRKVDQLKSDFVSTVSHELRTPLAISTEGINLIVDGIVGEITDQQKELLVTSKDNLTRLNQIINDLLDISKIEAGKIDLRPRGIDLRILLVRLTNAYKKVLDMKEQTLKVSFPEESVYLYGDGDKVIQIVTNLLNNAHKFSPQGGRIELALKKMAGEVVCSVQDNGVGISEEDIPKLFEKFQQFGRTHGPGIKGTGLGLAICKALVELHKGRIWAERCEPKGTIFFFSLPDYSMIQKNFYEQIRVALKESKLTGKSIAKIVLYFNSFDKIRETYGDDIAMGIINAFFEIFNKVASHAEDLCVISSPSTICALLPDTNKSGAEAVILRIKNVIRTMMFEIKEEENLNLRFGMAVYPEDASNVETLIQKAEENAKRKKRILVVDDDSQIIKMLETRLAVENFNIDIANDGEQAMEIIETQHPDLIILDIMMPKMNGYEVLGRLKGNVATAAIPVIILTAKTVEIVKSEFRNLDNIPILEKTVGFAELINLVQKMI